VDLLTLLHSKARCGLLVPLGGYLCCGYAIKRRLRKSLFLRRHISLPEPWIEIRSLVGKPVFIDSDTGASTSIDPRLRAFPVKGQDRRAGIRSSKYIKAYNASPSTCKEYWGHLGRVWTTRYRKTPTVSLLFSVWFVFFLVVKGIICIDNYHINMDRDSKLSRFTLPDLKRIYRIMNLVGYFSINTAGIFGPIIFFYAFSSTISGLALWVSIKRTGSRNVT